MCVYAHCVLTCMTDRVYLFIFPLHKHPVPSSQQHPLCGKNTFLLKQPDTKI